MGAMSSRMPSRPRRMRSSVLHVDYEQGSRLTRERYQRLARCMGLPPEALDDPLGLMAMPGPYLDQTSAEDALVKACDGCDRVTIDCLRAAAPSIEENSSDFRRPPDLLTRVSERIGCAALVIHHARNPNRENQGGAKNRRGLDRERERT
jgi:hypothetical protein